MSNKNNKILVVGDLHIKENLNYANYIEDERKQEEQEIFNYIVQQSEDCDDIVFLGDQLHKKVNPSQTIAKFVNFIENFHDKNVYMIKGNHEGHPSGSSAIDFLKEIKNDKWNIITNEIKKIDIGGVEAVFLPYFTKAELEVKENKEANKKIRNKLPKADILFHHHTMTHKGKIAGIELSPEQLPEPTLSVETLTKRYSCIFGGHIHPPNKILKNVFVAGSVFTNEVGEAQKYIYKIDKNNLNVETIPLPGRAILEKEDPTKEDLEKEEKNNIIKAIFTKKKKASEMRQIKEILGQFDAYVVVEKTSKTKKKMHYGEGESILEFDIDKLLEIYAKEREMSLEELQHGFNLIKK